MIGAATGAPEAEGEGAAEGVAGTAAAKVTNAAIKEILASIYEYCWVVAKRSRDGKLRKQEEMWTTIDESL